MKFVKYLTLVGICAASASIFSADSAQQAAVDAAQAVAPSAWNSVKTGFEIIGTGITNAASQCTAFTGKLQSIAAGLLKILSLAPKAVTHMAGEVDYLVHGVTQAPIAFAVGGGCTCVVGYQLYNWYQRQKLARTSYSAVTVQQQVIQHQ